MVVKIWPRKTTDKGGYICMPLVSNIPNGRIGWKRTVCPVCGRECWEMPVIEDLQKSGAVALCTQCALQKAVVSKQ